MWLLFAGLCLASVSIPAAEPAWLLLSRHDGCFAIDTLKRKIPDLGEVTSPDEFVRLMRRRGYAVSTREFPDTAGKTVEVIVPEQGLALLFATREICRNR